MSEIAYEDWSITFDDGTEASWAGEFWDTWSVMAWPTEEQSARREIPGGLRTIVHRLGCPEEERS